MSSKKEQITKAIYSSIDDLNEMLAPEQRLEKTLGTTILTQGGGLDSLGFVNFLALVEEKYFEQFGQRIVLTEIDGGPNGRHPYESIGSLVEYIDLLATKGR